MHFALYEAVEANEENSDALIKTVDILVRSFVRRHPSFFFCQHLQRQNDKNTAGTLTFTSKNASNITSFIYIGPNHLVMKSVSTFISTTFAFQKYFLSRFR